VCYHLNICFNIYFLNLSLSFIHVGIELMFIGVMDLIVGLQILIATMNSVHQVMIQKLLLFALFFNYSPFLTLLFYSIGFFEFYLIFKVVFPLYSIGFCPPKEEENFRWCTFWVFQQGGTGVSVICILVVVYIPLFALQKILSIFSFLCNVFWIYFHSAFFIIVTCY
jgi:hypothetical protein